MLTRILRTHLPEDIHAIDDAVAVLRAGGIVAFPTETVYGLGADALNPDAVAKVFAAKGRPADNPLIVHLSSPLQMERFARRISGTAIRLAETFWPGPLTLVVESRDEIPQIVRAGLPTVALRVPRHEVPIALAENLGSGLVGPSANRSGKPSPTTAQHVADDLRGMIDMILDAGPTVIGLESTVVDVSCDPPAILRFGGLSREEIERVIGPVEIAVKPGDLRKSPGTRHRHYAPHATVIVVAEGDADILTTLYDRYTLEGKKTGCIIHSPLLTRKHPAGWSMVLGPGLPAIAGSLFAAMREADAAGLEVLLVEAVPQEGIGKAIMDRLRRASE